MKTETYLKVRITSPMKEHLNSEASKLDLTLSTYVRYLIIKDVHKNNTSDEYLPFIIFESLDSVYANIRQLIFSKNMIKMWKNHKKKG